MVLGETFFELLAETEPMPWLIVTEVTLAEVQERVEELPSTMVDGLADMVQVGAGLEQAGATVVA